MFLAISMAAAIVAFAAVAFLRKPNEAVLRVRRARIALVAALVILGLVAAFWTMFGIGEIAGGDWSGVSHLVPAALVVVLMFLVRKRPLEGGILFAILGAAISVYFLAEGKEDAAAGAVAALLTGVPLLAAGALLIVAALFARMNPPPQGVSP